MKKKITWKSVLWILLLILIIIIVAFPLYWMFIGAFKTKNEFFTNPPVFSLKPLRTNAFQVALFGIGGKGLKDSLIIASFSTIISLFIGALAAHGIVHYHIGKKNLIFIFLVIQMMPPVSLAIPLFLMFNELKLLDTYVALIISNTVFNLPYAIWLLTGFYEEIPESILEAGKIDGASNLTIFTKLVLPLVKPGLMATGFFTFIFGWNEFILAFTFCRTKVKPLTVAIPTMVGSDTIVWEQVYATSIVAIVPVLILAIFMQKYLIRGLSFGAVKE
ncbi:MAG: carbohydrate ABC transporter permease [Candidatus Cloacimonetes bacterium]|nr:carbohydrate ABC transporter permease [Candidatus Cloacimonadota bacterium]